MLRSLNYLFNGLLILVAGGGLLTVRDADPLLSLGLMIGLCVAVLNCVLMAKPNVELFYARLGAGLNALGLLTGVVIAVQAVRMLAGQVDPPEALNMLGALLAVFAAICLVATGLAAVIYVEDIRNLKGMDEKPRV